MRSTRKPKTRATPMSPSFKEVDEALEAIMLAWACNPVLFARDALGMKLELWQIEFLSTFRVPQLLYDNKVRDELKVAELPPAIGRASVRSGHGVGKSAALAALILWKGSCYADAKIPCTAPTAHQLFDVLWTEVAKWARNLEERAPWIHQGMIIKSDRIDWTHRAMAVARTARREKPEALQGFHANHLLFVMDEASGIDEAIFEVGEGALSTPYAQVAMAANPTRSSGYFYQSHHADRSRWHCIKVGCADSSRVDHLYPTSVATKYGRDSNVYRVRVLGEFPTSDDDSLIPLELLEAAAQRDVEGTHARMIWGLDVARFGDDRTTLAKRKGNLMIGKVEAWRGKDTMQTADRVFALWKDTPPIDRPDVINVDVIGIGAGVVDRLIQHGLPAVGINVSESPASRERFNRLRDELWFLAREWFEGRDCKIERDEDFIAEMSVVKYRLADNGKLKVESKEETKKRLMAASPDLADAFVLTFASSDNPMVYNTSLIPEVYYDGV